ncbi:MAG: hypothetical protein RJA47_1745 [Actinomycetota bacterium]|jgi:AcrR family transcriptional regulator
MKNSGGNERRRRGSLSREEIVAAAEVVARDARPLTIREISSEMGASPMSLYRYFPTREDLMAALVDTILERVVVPSAGPWDSRLHQLAEEHSRVLSAHPWAVPILFDHPVPGLNAMRLGESYLEIFTEAGMNGDDAVTGLMSVLALVYGRAGFVAGKPTTALPTVPASRLPLSSANAGQLSEYGDEKTFSAVLELLVMGVKFRLRA